MPCDTQQISDLLKDSIEFRDKIIRSVGNFTVALMGIYERPERLDLAGTGTLMTIAGAHYILTARHVWDDKLAHADYVGLTLKPNIDHKYAIRRTDFTTVGLPKPSAWNEWGPDLMLLKIPEEKVGAIKAYRSFWNPARRIEIKNEVIELTVIMGTPGELGTITDTHADLQITGLFVGDEKLQSVGGFDFLDYKIHRNIQPGLPRHLGGTSGGGLWRVWVFCSKERDEIDWTMGFHGVAFYQLDIDADPTIVRCHGPESGKLLLRTLGAHLE